MGDQGEMLQAGRDELKARERGAHVPAPEQEVDTGSSMEPVTGQTHSPTRSTYVILETRSLALRHRHRPLKLFLLSYCATARKHQ